jgi:hypothetical protein
MVDNLSTFMSRLSRNLRASTAWNPKGLSRPVMGLLYLYFFINELERIRKLVKNLRYLSDICQEELWKTMNILFHKTSSPGWISIQGPST